MPQNFLSCEREQVLLMPPSLRDWLPEDHLAWFVLASVESLLEYLYWGPKKYIRAMDAFEERQASRDS